MPFSGQELEACQGTPEFAAEFSYPTGDRAGSREVPGGEAADDASRSGCLTALAFGLILGKAEPFGCGSSTITK